MAASKRFTVVAARTASHWRMKLESSGALANDIVSYFDVIGLFVESETVIVPSAQRAPTVGTSLSVNL